MAQLRVFLPSKPPAETAAGADHRLVLTLSLCGPIAHGCTANSRGWILGERLICPYVSTKCITPSARMASVSTAARASPMSRQSPLSALATSAAVVRYNSPDPNRVREEIGRVWRGMFPDAPFEGEFADEQLAELYQADAARGQTFAGFALLAVLIACLGLFGLAAFTAERRTKEIGIRKVFGARSIDIVGLLAWQFSKPVIIANLIAWPIAWWVMRDWLNAFDSRIDLGPGPFVLAGGLALAIALGTIAGHALKVSRANPVHALRYE